MELEDQDTGERISLIDKVAGSVANPANRRRELMTRMRGFEDLAKLEGLAGDFYTLTAPSRYHSMQHNGRRNNKYCGASPRETQQYLCKVWGEPAQRGREKGSASLVSAWSNRTTMQRHTGIYFFLCARNASSRRVKSSVNMP